MPGVMNSPVFSVLLLIASWSHAALTGGLLAYEAIGKLKKPWGEMTIRERTNTRLFTGLGCYAGILSFLLLVAIAKWEGAFTQSDPVLVLVWVIVGMLMCYLGGAIAVRRKIGQDPERAHELRLLHEQQDGPTDTTEP